MPMRPSEKMCTIRPMRPMNIRSGYEGYRRTIDRRREVTERPVSGRVNSAKGKRNVRQAELVMKTEIVYRR